MFVAKQFYEFAVQLQNIIMQGFKFYTLDALPYYGHLKTIVSAMTM